MKKKIILVVAFIVVAGGSFFGGLKYQQSKSDTALASAAVARGANGTRAAGFAGGTGARRTGAGGAGGSFIVGQILSKDDKSITVKGQDGSSKIIYLSASSQISKSTTGSNSDLSTGTNVVVTGATNSDGSITAQTIQIRPPMANPPAGN